ncbi:MAG: carboxypeptidase-like regulatory domain-containing protein [Bacteroidota bacterium]
MNKQERVVMREGYIAYSSPMICTPYIRNFFALAVASLSFASVLFAQTPAVDDAPAQEAVPIAFEVKRVGKIEVISLQRDNQVYLPVSRVFDFLRIKHEYDPVVGRITGFLVTADTPYVIDVTNGRLVVGKRSMALVPGDYAVRDNDIYLRVELFDTMFGLPVVYRPRQLSASLSTNLALPIFLDQRLRRLENELALRRDRPLPEASFGRSMSFVDGARLDYSLRQSLSSTSNPTRSFFSRFTGHLLGGDVEARFNGSITPDPRIQQTRARWRFVPQRPTSTFRQLTIGDFITSGILSRQIYGVEISNRPPYSRTVFSDESFFGVSDLARNVYFYDNFKLFSVQQPESSGVYRFDAPLRYGVNFVDIRHYSMWGEPFGDTYRIFIPSTLVPPKEIDYNISVGRLRDASDPWYGEMVTQWGVSSRVTTGARVEFFDIDGLPTKIYPSLNAVARITEHMLGEMVLSPNAFYRGNIEFTLPSLVGASFSYQHYRRDNRLFNARNAINEMAATVILPFSANGARFSFDIGGQQTILVPGRERTMRAGASLFTGIFTPRITTRMGWFHSYVTEQTNRAFHETEPIFRVRLPANLLFSVSSRFDHLLGEFVDARINVVLQPRPNLDLEFLYDKNFILANDIMRFRVQYVLPYIRFTGVVTSTEQSVLYSQTLSGSIGAATQIGEFFFDNNAGRAGFGAILVSPFLDVNNNGIRDVGEEVLTSARLRASRLSDGDGASFSAYPGVGWGTTRAIPYTTYTVEIDKTGFENPLWIPRYSVLEISAAPGRFSYIEMPIISGGAVRGAVLIDDQSGEPFGVEGVRVRIRETVQMEGIVREPFERVVETFSTGDFEFLAVPPGTYEVSVDPIQLTLSGLLSKEISKIVTVESERDGDFVEGVNFIVTELE